MYIHFDAFTEEAQRIARQVIAIASRYNQVHLGIELILLALFETPGEELEKIFARMQIDKELVRENIKFVVSRFPHSDPRIVKDQQFTVSKDFKEVVKMAQFEANRSWSKDIRPVHLFLAVFQVFSDTAKNTACGRIIDGMNTNVAEVRKMALKISVDN
jgi:ATP-dependent Clp protease ATP-binding subunit ClpA